MTKPGPERTRVPHTLPTPDERSDLASLLSDEASPFLLFHAIRQPVLVLDEGRRAVFANDAFCGVLGLESPHSVYGRLPGELLDCANASLAADGCGTSEACGFCGAAEVIERALAGSDEVQECRILQVESGGALDLRVWGHFQELGGRRYCILSYQDISAEKRRLALERVFFHDVLNTAGGLSGLAHLMRAEELSDGEELEYRETVAHLASQLVHEIEGQRLLGEAERDQLAVEPVELELGTLLTEVAESYRHQLAYEGRRIVVANGGASATFRSDRTLLVRVLGNMLKNALEACREGDCVTLSFEELEDGVELHVHNPTSMSSDVQLQLFQRSFSTKGAGRGLGTYSMRLLAERYLQGRIRFESGAEGGTTFHARFPRVLE